MSVVFLILKIIGYTLLSIVATLIFLVLVVLFVPIRYRLNASYNKKTDFKNDFVAKAKGSFLLHALTVVYEFGKTKPLEIKLFGIKLSKKADNKDRSDKANKSGKKNKAEKKKSPEKLSEASMESGFSKKEIPLDFDDNEDAISSQSSLDNQNEVSDLTDDSFETALDETKADKTKEKSNTKSSFYDKLKAYIEILKSDLFKKTYKKVRKKIVRALVIVLPRNWHIDAIVGFDDPALTGKILAITGMLYPIISKHISVKGDFENEQINIACSLKGHFTLAIVLFTFLKLYFNKNIKKLIKLFKEV